MKQKWDKMLRYRMLALISISVVVLFAIILTASLIISNSSDYNGKNKDFAKITATGSVETKTFDVENVSNLLFFSEAYRKERTLFSGNVPNLKIVNSDRYEVEVTTHKELIEKLDIITEEENLYIGFDSEYYYNASNVQKTYNKGLYVECTQFDITVYAPISQLRSNAEFNLDFEAPKTDEILIIVQGAVKSGRVYNVDSKVAGFNFQGDSNVKVEGRASDIFELVAKHNTKIDATNFSAEIKNVFTGSQLFGYCLIELENGNVYPFTDSGFLLTLILIFVPSVCVICAAIFVLKFLKYKKFVDEAIEKNEF